MEGDRDIIGVIGADPGSVTPTNVWDTNYLAVNAYAAPTLFQAPRAGPTMMILGKEDDTQVTINPVVDIQPGGGLPGTQVSIPVTYTVNRGQYLQLTQPGNPITWPPDNGGSDEANPQFTRWVSYGYPAGANIAQLNDVILKAK